MLIPLFLSGSDPELLVGNFMGDFVKGLLGDFDELLPSYSSISGIESALAPKWTHEKP